MDKQVFIARAERQYQIFDLGLFDNEAEANHAAKDDRRHLTDSEKKNTESWVYAYCVPEEIETLDEFNDYMEENPSDPCDCKRIITSPELRRMVAGKDYGDPHEIERVYAMLRNDFKFLGEYAYDVLFGEVWNAWCEEHSNEEGEE